ncbi:hypothetical protein K9M41_01190 [Candidatus Gracilibacteria bacterium]|nr:hypothetical protein [Candidatus Gracilibacteria bacterium]
MGKKTVRPGEEKILDVPTASVDNDGFHALKTEETEQEVLKRVRTVGTEFLSFAKRNKKEKNRF